MLSYLIVISVPLLLVTAVAWLCRQRTQAGWLLVSFVLGAIAVLPISRLGTLIEPAITGVAGHFYADELLSQLLSTAFPEEWGKGLVALLIWRLAGRPTSPSTAVAFAAASHGGFAAVEGILGALGNEGWLKVILGRSLGASLHCSWGIVAAWLLWFGWQHPRWRILNCSVALLLPALLHTVGNAAQMDIPGVSGQDGEAVTLKELAVVLPGLAATLLTWALAVWALLRVRSLRPDGDGGIAKPS